MVSWTVFVSGDSYNGGRFSTRWGNLDTVSGALAGTLESFTVDGRAAPSDANLWGVTFTGDDNAFYSTMSSGDRRSLVIGDFTTRDLHVLKDNVECPSLSPDGTRIACKKMLPGGRGWRLTVLRPADLAETPLAETRSVDHQAAWLDDATVGYGLPHGSGGADVWSVPADGGGARSCWPRTRRRRGHSAEPGRRGGRAGSRGPGTRFNKIYQRARGLRREFPVRPARSFAASVS